VSGSDEAPRLFEKLASSTEPTDWSQFNRNLPSNKEREAEASRLVQYQRALIGLSAAQLVCAVLLLPTLSHVPAGLERLLMSATVVISMVAGGLGAWGAWKQLPGLLRFHFISQIWTLSNLATEVRPRPDSTALRPALPHAHARRAARAASASRRRCARSGRRTRCGRSRASRASTASPPASARATADMSSLASTLPRWCALARSRPPAAPPARRVRRASPRYPAHARPQLVGTVAVYASMFASDVLAELIQDQLEVADNDAITAFIWKQHKYTVVGIKRFEDFIHEQFELLVEMGYLRLKESTPPSTNSPHS
jgi:hypothetical protein